MKIEQALIPAVFGLMLLRSVSGAGVPEGIYLTQDGLAYLVFRKDAAGVVQYEDGGFSQSSETRVRQEADSILVEWRYQKENYSGPNQDLIRSLPEIPWTWIKEFKASSEAPGDWDLVAFNQDNWDPKAIDKPRNKQSCMIKQALHFLNDPLVLECLQSKEDGKSFAAAEALLKAHPNDLFVRSLYLELVAKSGNLQELQRLLALWRTDFSQSTNAVLQHRPQQMDVIIKGLQLNQEGKNAFQLNQQLSKMDLMQLVQRYPELLKCSGFVPSTTETVPEWDTMIRAKVMYTVALFWMISGQRTQALQLLSSSAHFGMLLREKNLLITAIFGAVVQQIATNGLQVYVENCCETNEEFTAFIQQMNAIRRFDTKQNVTDLLLFESVTTMQLIPEVAQEATERMLVADAKFDLARMSAAAKHHLLNSGAFPAKDEDFAPLLPDGPPPDWLSPATEKMKFVTGSDPFLCYSVGPDGKDDKATLQYDPTNGTISSGDIFVSLKREREFPFPRQGTRATSKAEFLRQYPNGLPRDYFADTKGKGLEVAETKPVCVFSPGPDQDEMEHLKQPNWVEFAYDPTNGTTSNGDLFLLIPDK